MDKVLEKKTLYNLGDKPYSPTFDAEVEIMFAEQLPSGNMYFVRYVTVTDEDVYNEDCTRIIGTEPKQEIFFERIFDHHSLGHPDLFHSKEEYMEYKEGIIQDVKSSLLSEDDYWMQELFGAFSRESYSNEHLEAMRRIVKEKTGIEV